MDLKVWIVMKKELASAKTISVVKNVTNVKKDMKSSPSVTAVLILSMGTQIVHHVDASRKGVKACLAIKVLEFVNVWKTMLERNVILVQSFIGDFQPVNVIILVFLT